MAGNAVSAFGALLRRYRLAANLTQEQLAARAGVSERGLRYLEQGTKRGHPDTLRRLAAALGLNLSEQEHLLAAARPMPVRRSTSPRSLQPASGATQHDLVPTFGTLLRRYRLATNLTQEALAARAGLSVRGIQDLERGAKQQPHQTTVDLLAGALRLGAAERALLEQARPLRVAPQLPRPPQAESIAPLVGRLHELMLLAGHLRGRGPPLLVLAGEPGIGKSRLLQALAQQAGRQGWSVLAGGCQRRAGQESYTPLLPAIEHDLEMQDAVQLRSSLTGCAWLVRLLPELAAGPIEPLPAWTLPPEQERRLMFRAVGRYFANRAGTTGTLLLLDDLQWAGVGALELLAVLIRSGGSGLRVVGAYRDTEVQAGDPLAVTLADLAQAGLAGQHSLGVLDPTESAVLLDRLGPARLHQTARTRILQRAGGVPFYLISCAQAVPPGEGADGVEDVPWSIAQSIRQRLAVLPPGTQAALDVAAVAGRQVNPDLVSRVAGREEQELLADLDRAVRGRILLDDSPAGYRFAHDLIREVVEADLSTVRRTRLHRGIAAALEATAGERPVEQLAYHYGRAGDRENAAVYLEQAGDRAWARHANAEAEGAYQELVLCLDG